MLSVRALDEDGRLTAVIETSPTRKVYAIKEPDGWRLAVLNYDGDLFWVRGAPFGREMIQLLELAAQHPTWTVRSPARIDLMPCRGADVTPTS